MELKRFLPYSSAKDRWEESQPKPSAHCSPVRPSLILSLPHGKTLTLGPAAALMGIVNVTPDSFSDGGAFASVAAAVAHGERLASEGAAILDVGGESTRPKASPVAADEEMARAIPVIAELSRRAALPISIDTMKARVAAAAIEAGASIVNDVWGFQKDPEIARVAADTGAAAVLMHNRDSLDASLDIVADVIAFLSRSIDLALAAGIAREKLILDPGFGFGKTPAQNFELIRRLGEFSVLGCPILIGVSRKSSIGGVTGQKNAAERLAGSLAAGLAGVANGAAILRVHDVAPHWQALQVLQAIGGPPQSREAE